jgi:hypothetical protein
MKRMLMPMALVVDTAMYKPMSPSDRILLLT